MFIFGDIIGIKDGVTEDQIKTLFTEAGEIEKVTIARQFDSKKNMGHAFVSFKVG